jgi:group I intron endonuclease
MSTRIVSGIYLIRNTVNGKVYVGSAVSLPRRVIRHKTDLRAGTHHSSLLQRAWTKYGEAVFVFSYLELVECKEDLVQREQVWMDQLGATDRERGYNMATKAGTALGIEHGPDFGAKVSAGKKGKKFSEAHRTNMSLARIGKKRPDVSAALTGRKQTPEHIANSTRGRTGKKQPAISAALKGRVFSEAWTAKLSAAAKARVVPQQTRDKIRLTLTGRKDSPETIERKRLAMVRRYGRMTELAARAIRASTENARILAELYGVTPMTIWDIRARRTWKHID